MNHGWIGGAMALFVYGPMALAAESSVDFPMQATVQLDGCGRCTNGAAVIRVPPALRSVDDPSDGSDLLLLDATGAPVPFAVAAGKQELSAVKVATLWTTSPTVAMVSSPSLPIDGLILEVPGTPAVGRVTVQNAASGKVIGQPTLIWSGEGSTHRRVDFPPTTAMLRVTLDWVGATPERLPTISGVRREPAYRPPDRVTVPVVRQRMVEDGMVTYTVQLDTPLPVRAVDLGAAEAAVVSRTVRVSEPKAEEYQPEVLLGAAKIKRVRLGGATLDSMRVPLEDPPSSDQFDVQIASEGQPILDIPTVDVLLDGTEIWFEPTGPGPYTLYGGAPPLTRPGSELQVALPELVRMASGTGVVQPAQRNPAYVPPVLRSGLAGPGRVLPQAEAFGFTAAVTGASGVVRIPLPAAVLAASQRELDDLRLTDVDGRQIPHLSRRSAADAQQEYAIDELERIEDDGVSRIVVPLDDPNVPVGTVMIETDATAFRRTVSVFRPATDHLVPVRSVVWNGAERPGAMAVAVDAPMGDRLVVEIDNGDDPPLPITGVTVFRPRFELVAVLPEAGATLHVGDIRRDSADFDVELYADDLLRRAHLEATVGPLVAQTAPSLASADRNALLAGLGVLVLGLVTLTVRLVRSVPASESGGPRARAGSPSGQSDGAGDPAEESEVSRDV